MYCQTITICLKKTRETIVLYADAVAKGARGWLCWRALSYRNFWAPSWRKIRQIARGGGTFRASKLSALGSHMCVWGNWAAAGPAAYEGLHDVGCALESFQFFSFEQFHVFFETNLGQKGWMTSPRRGLRTKKTRCRKVASRRTCYYSWNQVFVDATNQDMFLFINSGFWSPG